MKRELAEGLAPIYLCHFCMEIADSEEGITEHMVNEHSDEEYYDCFGE